MLTVVRRAVPGSTKPRRRAAAAAAGAQQQSSALYQTSSGAMAEICSNSLHQRSFSLAAAASGSSSATAAPVSRPSPSGSPSHSYPALPSPRWEVAGQGCSARPSSKEARFVAIPSSSSCSTSNRSVATKAGGVQQEQYGGARGASSSAGEGLGAEMVVTPVSIFL